MKMDYQAREDGRRGDGVREGGGQGQGRGIIKSCCSRGQDAKGRGGRGAGDNNIF